MSLDRLVGQDAVKNRLVKGILGVPNHAVIFTGNDGIGKHEFAGEYAKALLCSNPTSHGACDKCNNCIYIDAKTHPDFITVEASDDKKNIKVEEIRTKVTNDVKICPQIARRKVYVIDADRLNEEGQNAILKSLEEPPENIFFALICENAELLLPTVTSRTIEYKLNSYSREEIRSVLQSRINRDESGSLSDVKTDFVVDFADGNIGRAIELVDNTDFLDYRSEIIDLVLGIGTQKYSTILTQRCSFFEDNADNIEEILLLLLWLLGDMSILIKQRDISLIRNKDYYDRIVSFLNNNRNVTINNISRASTLVTTTRKRLNLNVNYLLAISDMLLGLKKELGND